MEGHRPCVKCAGVLGTAVKCLMLKSSMASFDGLSFEPPLADSTAAVLESAARARNVAIRDAPRRNYRCKRPILLMRV